MKETAKKTANETAKKKMNETTKRTMNGNAEKTERERKSQITRSVFNNPLGPRAQNIGK